MIDPGVNDVDRKLNLRLMREIDFPLKIQKSGPFEPIADRALVKLFGEDIGSVPAIEDRGFVSIERKPKA
jgi:hypothetical protein